MKTALRGRQKALDFAGFCCLSCCSKTKKAEGFRASGFAIQERSMVQNEYLMPARIL